MPIVKITQQLCAIFDLIPPSLKLLLLSYKNNYYNLQLGFVLLIFDF
jgi:hypothetical protein